MTIGDRVFQKMSELGMTQKEFSKRTGIAQSTISEWKSKRTNPTSEKIMIICNVLDVSPEWLLSGVENTGRRGNKLDWYVINKKSEEGQMIAKYNQIGSEQQAMMRGYLFALYEQITKAKKSDKEDE